MARAAAMAVESPRRPDAAAGSEDLAVAGVSWADAAKVDPKTVITIIDATNRLIDQTFSRVNQPNDICTPK